MKVRLTWQYFIAFFALNGVVSELHEQAHITVGRLITGCYGPRDFNNWLSCADGPQSPPWAPPLAGPLFSYLVMWLGVWLLQRAQSTAQKSLAFSLVFAPLPFARIFTAVMGGGDEKIMLLRMFDGLPEGAARWGALALTLLFCAPPIVMACRALTNHRRAWYVAGFCVVPLLVIWFYKLKFLNGLLQQGLFAEPVIIGTPLFVHIVFGVMLATTALMWPWLQRLEGLPPKVRGFAVP
ncbi:hypothetical protein [Massilia endophytica]|uniref:hypothetical protein n=1 Tax=Massilia endophytica TaxID=2899220 RepID=UPI001E42319A|nr:hypothetical protein [Massilia endophytica]UGQ46153.1 hypothetical protein LSQ66_20655 [Massilia endophytica]